MVVSGVRLLIKLLIQSMPRKSTAEANQIIVLLVLKKVFIEWFQRKKHKNSPHYVIVLR